MYLTQVLKALPYADTVEKLKPCCRGILKIQILLDRGSTCFIKRLHPKRFKVTTDSDHNEVISPNLLNRQFDVAAPNKVWTTDITYVWTLEGRLYVAIVIDLFSRQVVGWFIADHMRTSLCVNALQMAFWRRKPEPGLMHHSDRGSQYASHEYRSHLGIMRKTA